MKTIILTVAEEEITKKVATAGEVFKEVKGAKHYFVSNKGNVYSKYSEQLLRKYTKNNGYVTVGITMDDGKKTKKYIHRLVAEAFLDNPDNLPEVNHKDEDKTNNVLENLEWCDSKYNHDYGSRVARCTDNKPSNFTIVSFTTDGEFVGIYKTAKEAGRKNNCDARMIRTVTRGENVTYKNKVWYTANDFEEKLDKVLQAVADLVANL